MAFKPGRSVICVRLLQLLHHVSIFYVGINSMILYMFRYYSTHTECLVYKTVHASGTRTPFCFCPVVWNSHGRNLGCSVSSTRTSSISSTQGIGLGREQLRYLKASLTNMNDNSIIRVVTTFTNLWLSKWENTKVKYKCLKILGLYLMISVYYKERGINFCMLIWRDMVRKIQHAAI